jgi:hypothetical protein
MDSRTDWTRETFEPELKSCVRACWRDGSAVGSLGFGSLAGSRRAGVRKSCVKKESKLWSALLVATALGVALGLIGGDFFMTAYLAVGLIAGVVATVFTRNLSRWWLLLTVPGFFWLYILGTFYYACQFHHDCL